MFGFFENKDKPERKENAMSESGKTYTLPPLPNLMIPDSNYAPIGVAITKWRALKGELEAKQKEIPVLERDHDALAAREFDEERLLKDERAAIKAKIAALRDEIDVLARIKIPKALVAVWAAAVDATKRENDFTRPHDEKWRVFNAACTAILEEVADLKIKARPAVSDHDYWSGTQVSLGVGRERESVSTGVVRKYLAGIAEPPLLPAAVPTTQPRAVLYTNPQVETYYPDGAIRKDVPPPRPEPLSTVTYYARPEGRNDANK